MRIYAATTNAGKLREFAACAQGGWVNGEAVAVLTLPGIERLPVPVEDAATFMGNAELKALAYSRAMAERGEAGMLVMADDSGLEVEALAGEPGVRSARWAEDAGFMVGSGKKVAERNGELLLDRMTYAGAWASRAARFVGALALARDGVVVLRAEGTVEGEITRGARGTGGFGYDPYFLVPARGKTLAEMSAEEKWGVSHRGRAFRELLRSLRAGELDAMAAKDATGRHGSCDRVEKRRNAEGADWFAEGAEM